jgi:hypothetical protein
MKITTIEQLKQTLGRIGFAKSCIDFGWEFEVEQLLMDGSGKFAGWFVNTTFKRPDTHTGEVGIGRGRKEFIPYGTYEDGVIKTAWVLCEMIVKHELMEAFLVDGKRIFDPHSSIEVLQYGKEVCREARPITP